MTFTAYCMTDHTKLGTYDAPIPGTVIAKFDTREQAESATRFMPECDVIITEDPA